MAPRYGKEMAEAAALEQPQDFRGNLAAAPQQHALQQGTFFRNHGLPQWSPERFSPQPDPILPGRHSREDLEMIPVTLEFSPFPLDGSPFFRTLAAWIVETFWRQE